MILDSDVLMDVLRRHQPAVAWFASLPAMPPTCRVAALELVYGARDLTELVAIYKFLELFTIIWPDTAGMNTALFDLARHKLSTNLGPLDGLIAATALGTGEPLATFKTKHFSNVPDHSIVQPYVRRSPAPSITGGPATHELLANNTNIMLCWTRSPDAWRRDSW